MLPALIVPMPLLLLSSLTCIPDSFPTLALKLFLLRSPMTSTSVDPRWLYSSHLTWLLNGILVSSYSLRGHCLPLVSVTSYSAGFPSSSLHPLSLSFCLFYFLQVPLHLPDHWSSVLLWSSPKLSSQPTRPHWALPLLQLTTNAGDSLIYISNPDLSSELQDHKLHSSPHHRYPVIDMHLKCNQVPNWIILFHSPQTVRLHLCCTLELPKESLQILMPKLYPQRFYFNWSGCSLGIKIFQSSLSDCNVQLRLRTTALKPSVPSISHLIQQYHHPLRGVSQRPDISDSSLSLTTDYPTIPSKQSQLQMIHEARAEAGAACALSLQCSMKRWGLDILSQFWCDYKKQSLPKKKELKESQRNKAEVQMNLGTSVAKVLLLDFSDTWAYKFPSCLSQFTLHFLMLVIKCS